MHLPQGWCLFPAVQTPQQPWGTWSPFLQVQPGVLGTFMEIKCPIPAHITAACPLYMGLIWLATWFFFYLFRELCELGPSIKDVLWFVGVLSLVDLFGGHEIDCYKPVVLQRSCVSERQAGSLLTTLLLIPVLTPCLNWNLHLAPTEVSSCSS